MVSRIRRFMSSSSQVPSAKCQVPTAKCQVRSAKCEVRSAKCEVRSAMKTEQPLDREIALALRRLADKTVVPPVEAAREAALMATFDAAQTYRGTPPRG